MVFSFTLLAPPSVYNLRNSYSNASTLPQARPNIIPIRKKSLCQVYTFPISAKLYITSSSQGRGYFKKRHDRLRIIPLRSLSRKIRLSTIQTPRAICGDLRAALGLPTVRTVDKTMLLLVSWKILGLGPSILRHWEFGQYGDKFITHMTISLLKTKVFIPLPVISKMNTQRIKILSWRLKWRRIFISGSYS